jgi:hypothetical protein
MYHIDVACKLFKVVDKMINGLKNLKCRQLALRDVMHIPLLFLEMSWRFDIEEYVFSTSRT